MDRELGSLLELLNFPKKEGMGISLAPGIFAMLFLKPTRRVLIFFDDEEIEPTGSFLEIKVALSQLNMFMVYGLADIQGTIVEKKTLAEAEAIARAGLRRKDGKKIKWHQIQAPQTKQVP